MLTSVSPAANIAAREGLIKHGGDAWKRERERRSLQLVTSKPKKAKSQCDS